MEPSKILVYDGSFNGFLSAVYTAFDHPFRVADISADREKQKSLFAETLTVETDLVKAKKVWGGIEDRQYQAVKKIYFAFLSERKGVEILLFRYIAALFGRATGTEHTNSESLLARIEPLALLVEQEKRRVEAAMKMRGRDGQSNFLALQPRYDILPLLTRNFRTRFPNRPWLLYDEKRHYGLYYHNRGMRILRLNQKEMEPFLQKRVDRPSSFGTYPAPSRAWQSLESPAPGLVDAQNSVLLENSAA